MFSKERVQLVGFANDNPLLQEYLGEFLFIEDNFGNKEVEPYPVIRLYCSASHQIQNYPVKSINLHKKRVSVSSPEWEKNQGLFLSMNEEGKWRFTTGTNSGWQGGSSGVLAFGGDQLLEVLRVRYPNVSQKVFKE